MKKCIFAGTFDPPTLGHDDTISQALKIFDEVVIAILINPAKTPLFTLQERKQMLSLLYGNNSRLRIIEWQGAVVDLLEKENTPFYVRGLRNTVDFEYEKNLYYLYKDMNPQIEVCYLLADKNQDYVSSSVVREIFSLGGDASNYLSSNAYDFIEKLYKKQ